MIETEAMARRNAQIQEIMSEMQTAAIALSGVAPAVSVFGSARLGPTSPWYDVCVTLTRALAQAELPVIAGGGPGLMEAANLGAYNAGGQSVGLNISLPHEGHHNPYQTLSLTFKHFVSRKAAFFQHSYAYVCLPGGYGTLDELFEALTLIRTKKAPPGPVFLLGKSYWDGLVQWLREHALTLGTISDGDIDNLIIEDDPQVIVRQLVEFRENLTRRGARTLHDAVPR